MAWKQLQCLVLCTCGSGSVGVGSSSGVSVVLTGSGNIPDGSFSNMYNLKSVEISNGCTGIGDNAFAWSGLESIVIPNTVRRIGDNAFSYTQITNIVIPNSVSSFGEDIMPSSRLVSMTVPSGITVSALYSGIQYNLETINYEGTESQWLSMFADYQGNDSLTLEEWKSYYNYHGAINFNYDYGE